MTYDPAGELKRFTRWRVQRVYSLASTGSPDKIHGSLIIAMGSRESNLRNIVGGGYFDPEGKWVTTGVDRGFLQINEVYHAAWLKSVPGCISGEWAEVYLQDQEGAFPQGRCPGLTAATKKAISILRYNLTHAAKSGIPEYDQLRVAVAGYNSGVGTAVNAYKNKGDPDYYTTGKDYSRDVLVRQKAIRVWLQRRGWA